MTTAAIITGGAGEPPAASTNGRHSAWLGLISRRDSEITPRDFAPEIGLVAISGTAFVLLGLLSHGLPGPLHPLPDLTVVLECLILGLAAIGYSTVRCRPAVATLLLICATSIVARSGGLLLGYIVQYRSRQTPLVDPLLAACDRMLRFDWLRLMMWTDAHPAAAAILRTCYFGCEQQFLLCVLLLSLFGRHRRLLVLTAAGFVSLIVVHLVPLLWPAVGPYGYFGVKPAQYPHLISATRRGASPESWRCGGATWPRSPATGSSAPSPSRAFTL